MKPAAAGVAVGAIVLGLLTGCDAAARSADPVVRTTEPAGPAVQYSGVRFDDDLDFGAGGVRLDVCEPERTSSGRTAGADAGARASVVAIHGGGWRLGDKQGASWRDVCGWLASEGFVVFQLNYRLAPEHPFPAAIDDVKSAVTWIRAPEQVDRFGLDPSRIGTFGDSAGGNLAALLGTEGVGDTTVGTRVAAVASLSAPIDLTAAGLTLGRLGAGFERIQLDYLGCRSYDDCPDAASASPIYAIDSSDPPFFVAHAEDDPLIPVEQSEALVAALEAASVDTTYAPVPGDEHALGILDDPLRDEIAGWFRDRLAPAA